MLAQSWRDTDLIFNVSFDPFIKGNSFLYPSHLQTYVFVFVDLTSVEKYHAGSFYSNQMLQKTCPTVDRMVRSLPMSVLVGTMSSFKISLRIWDEFLLASWQIPARDVCRFRKIFFNCFLRGSTSFGFSWKDKRYWTCHLANGTVNDDFVQTFWSRCPLSVSWMRLSCIRRSVILFIIAIVFLWLLNFR